MSRRAAERSAAIDDFDRLMDTAGISVVIAPVEETGDIDLFILDDDEPFVVFTAPTAAAVILGSENFRHRYMKAGRPRMEGMWTVVLNEAGDMILSEVRSA